MQLLGLFSAAADVIPLGRLFMRPLQMALLAQWRPFSSFLNQAIAISLEIRSFLRQWLNQSWLSKGIPLDRPQAEITVCTDTSTWGAHLLPNFATVSGTWEKGEKPLHINLLEMKAVINAFHFWKDQLFGKIVLIMSDNSVVVSYLLKQGGTKSPDLCILIWQFLRWCDNLHIHVQIRHIPG